MGYVFEELIRQFNEAANETAGDHFTPREVIRLMVNLLFEPDSEILTRRGIVQHALDPACGTGGMLSVADEYLRELNPDARLEVFGQDHNPESYAVCGSDMLIKGQNIEHIVFGSSFTEDGFPGESSTTCSPIRPSAWSGSQTPTRSARSTRPRLRLAVLGQACRASMTDRSFSCST